MFRATCATQYEALMLARQSSRRLRYVMGPGPLSENIHITIGYISELVVNQSSRGDRCRFYQIGALRLVQFPEVTVAWRVLSSGQVQVYLQEFESDKRTPCSSFQPTEARWSDSPELEDDLLTEIADGALATYEPAKELTLKPCA